MSSEMSVPRHMERCSSADESRSLRLDTWDRSSDLLGPRASRPHRGTTDTTSGVEINVPRGGRDARGPSTSLDVLVAASGGIPVARRL
jgi:hypothetical protein